MTLLVAAMWLAGGAAALGVAARLTEVSEARRQRETLALLLEAAAPSAAAAAFVRDPDLAREVVEGLVASRGVREASLVCDGRPLASARRRGAGQRPAAPMSRPVLSPFGPPAPMGELTLVPDPGEAALETARTVSGFRWVLLGLTLGGAGILAVTLRLAILRPVGAYSRALEELDPQSGGRLALPRAWGELGQLGRDLGRVVAGLTETLAQGREGRARLEREKLELQAILDTLAAGVFVVRGDGVLDAWNRRFLELLGQGPVAEGRPLAELFGPHAARVATCLAQCAAEGVPASEVLAVSGAGDGPQRLLRLSLDPVGPRWIQGTLEEVGIHPAGAAEAETLDPLTGALNRLGADRAMSGILANDARGMGLLMVALGPGEPPPDLLRAAASRMASILWPTDRVARLRGGEFLLVLGGLREPEEARRIGDRVLAALAEPFPEAGGASNRWEAWAGATVLGPDEEPYRQDLLKRAGQALDLARAEGPFTCRVLP